MSTCSTEGCRRKVRAKGLCPRCYSRAYYHSGRPLFTDGPQITSKPVHHLINFLRGSGCKDQQIAKALGINTRNVSRLLARETISVYAADSIACAWGEHPIAWWSDWGSDLSEEEVA